MTPSLVATSWALVGGARMHAVVETRRSGGCSSTADRAYAMTVTGASRVCGGRLGQLQICGAFNAEFNRASQPTINVSFDK